MRSESRLTHLLFTLGAGSALAGPGVSQEFEHTPASPTGHHASILSTLTGDFNGDAVLDFALVRSADIVLVISPGLFESVVTIPAPPVDPNDLSNRTHFAAAVAIPGPLGDDLVAATTTGLVHFSLHDTQGRWQPSLSSYPGQSAREIVGVALAGSPTSCVSLHAWPLPAVGGTLVAAQLSSDQVPLGLVTPASGWIALPALALPAAPHDLALADLDADGMPEVAAADNFGVNILRYDGTLYFAHAIAGGAHFIERIRFGNTAAGAPQQGLAAVSNPTNGSATITTMGGNTVRPAVTCAGIDVERVVAKPNDDGSGFDLVLMDEQADLLRIYSHAGLEVDLTSFADRFVVGAGAGAGDVLYLSSATFGDIDGDGDCDLYIPNSSYQWGGMFEAMSTDADTQTPTVNWDATGWYDQTDPAEMIGSSLKVTLGAPIELPDGATHLELSVWSTRVTPLPGGGPKGTAGQYPSFRQVYPLTVFQNGGEAQFEIPGFLVDYSGLNAPTNELLHTFVARVVTLDDADLVIESGPCAIEYMWQGGTAANPLIAAYVARWSESDLRYIAHSPAPGQGWGSEVGNSRTGSCIPGHGKKPPVNSGAPPAGS